MSHTCSVLSLCVAAITCLVAVALVGIAFSTDNWVHISVNRYRLEDFAQEISDPEVKESLKYDLETNIHYFDRVQGIFRICFPYSEKPRIRAKAGVDDVVLYLNPVEEWCVNINYFVDTLQAGLAPLHLTYDATAWLHLSRCCVMSFAIFFMFTGIACVTGLAGCWKANGDFLTPTAVLMLLAAGFGAGGIGLWHGAQFYEYNRVHDMRLGFYLTWPEYLRENSSFFVGWSYIVAWIGIGITFISAIMFAIASACISFEMNEIKKEEALLKMQYMFPPHYHWPATSRRHSLHSGTSSPPPPFSPPGFYPATYGQFDDNFGKYKNVVKEFEEAKV